MTGTISLPATISITQVDLGPSVSVTSSDSVVLPAGVPPYPLASDPSQTWSLQSVDGVLTWVKFTAPPGQAAIALEDGVGAIRLEDGDGYILMEQ
jgi:hypothetical protein